MFDHRACQSEMLLTINVISTNHVHTPLWLRLCLISNHCILFYQVFPHVSDWTREWGSRFFSMWHWQVILMSVLCVLCEAEFLKGKWVVNNGCHVSVNIEYYDDNHIPMIREMSSLLFWETWWLYVCDLGVLLCNFVCHILPNMPSIKLAKLGIIIFA